MKIKCKHTAEHAEWLKRSLDNLVKAKEALKSDYEKELKEIEEKISNFLEFWETNKKPIYDSSIEYNRKLDMSKACEATTIYKGSGMISSSTGTEMSFWVCDKCFRQTKKKYIATGHDHTDYSYEVCDCDGVQGNKRYKD